MYLHRHHVRRARPGVTGRPRLRALVAGARHPPPGAQERDARRTSRTAPMATAWEGAERPAQRGTRTPSLARAEVPPQPSAACAPARARGRAPCAALVAPEDPPGPPPTTAQRRPHRTAPALVRRPPLARIRMKR